MDVAQMLERFELLAETPGGLARVRQLVLELAVRGRLVAQDASDEPASVLLGRIAEERARLVREKKLPKGKPLPSVHEDEQPFALPKGWAWAHGAEVFQFVTSGSRGWAKHYSPLGALFLRVGNLNYMSIDLDMRNTQHVRLPENVEGTRTRTQAGDILVSITGDPGMVAVVPADLGEAYVNQHVSLSRPWNSLCSAYLGWFICSDSAQEQLATRERGLKRSLGLGDILALAIALPPVGEQRRIVAKVDELMAWCGKIEQRIAVRDARRVIAREAVLAVLARADDTAAAWKRAERSWLALVQHKGDVPVLWRTVLDLAVRGRLVAQDASDEPASVLLGRIAEERARLVREKKLPKGKPLPSVHEDEQPFALPKGWAWTRVGVAGAVQLGRQRSPKNHHGSKMRPYLRVANVHENHIDTHDVMEMNFSDKEYERFALASGDVLLNEGQSYELVGRPALYRGEVPGACFQNTLLRFRAHAPILPEFSLLVFRAYLHNGRFRREAQQTTNIAHLSAGRLSSIEFPVPPLAEQRRIVAKVDELMARCETLEASLFCLENAAQKFAVAIVDQMIGRDSRVTLSKTSEQAIKAKMNDYDSEERRNQTKPLELSTESFVLKRFAMSSGYRSLANFDCVYHAEDAKENLASPICLVGLNGSGKSNLIEAIADVFCFVELINLPWKKVESPSSRYRQNDHRFEIAYLHKDSSGTRTVRISKTKTTGVEMFIDIDGAEHKVPLGRDQLRFLPRRIIGYSSGLNETVSHPFLRTKTIYSEEVRDAAPPDDVEVDETNRVFDTRTLYMDYESNAAIIICNYIFQDIDKLSVFNEYTRVRGVSSFGLRFNRKRAGKSGPNSIVRLTGELRSYLKKFVTCAGGTYNKNKVAYNLDFQLTPELAAAFRKEFGTAENLFMAMHKWSLLNALILSDDQRKVYLREDVTKGALERPPSVPPNDRVFNIVDLTLKLSVPDIEIPYSALSDGEHQFTQVFGTVLLFNNSGSLFLFDEPESHLNPEWRTKFNLVMSRTPNATTHEYVISTHSPFLVSGSRLGNVYKFIRTNDRISCEPIDFETYGAAFDILLKKLFSMDSMIDQGARKDLEQIIHRGNLNEMQEAVENFAESKEKRRLYEAIIRQEDQ